MKLYQDIKTSPKTLDRIQSLTNPQDMFNYIARLWLKQNSACTGFLSKHPRYHNWKGQSCAIGFLINPKEYASDLENYAPATLINLIVDEMNLSGEKKKDDVFPDSDYEVMRGLLIELQGCHDFSISAKWNRKNYFRLLLASLNDIADLFSLRNIRREELP